jgi:P27 family predicted phage terminase small subunit
MLARTDRDLVEGFAVLVAARQNALDAFNRTGNVILTKDSNGRPTGNPYLREYRRLTEQLRVLMGELGFTPATRSRVALMSNEDDDVLQSFL